MKTYNHENNFVTESTFPLQFPLLTGVSCSEVTLYSKYLERDAKIAVVVDRWSLFGGGRYLGFDVITLVSKFNVSTLNAEETAC